MRFTKNLALAGMLAVSAMASLPTQAFAHDHREHGYSRYDDDEDDGWRDRREYRRNYYRGARYDHRSHSDCRTSGTTGLIVGGALGALLGRGVDRYGDRATGTILGAGGGALIGRELDRKHRC